LGSVHGRLPGLQQVSGLLWLAVTFGSAPLGGLAAFCSNTDRLEAPMRPPENREMGPQPIAELMAVMNLKPNDLVQASPEQLTHKMVTRAMKGRWLTRNTQGLVLRAFSHAAGKPATLAELFTY
jgi:hypothetical protein